MPSGEGIISRRAAVLFSGPALLVILAFLAFPALWVIVISLTDLTLASIQPARFIGLANYSRILNDHFFWNALKVSLIFVLASGVIGQAGLGLSLAVFLHGRQGMSRSILVSAAVLAWILPEVVVAYSWAAFLDQDAGLLNRLLGLFGLPAVNWMSYHTALFSIIVFNTWRGAAFSLLLFSAALSSLPPSYLETADTLGAGPWRRFRDIILPLIRGSIFTALILITLWTFNVFTPFLLTRGGPSFSTELLPVFIYRTAFLGPLKLGYGSAAAAIMLLLNLALGTMYLLAGRKK